MRPKLRVFGFRFTATPRGPKKLLLAASTLIWLTAYGMAVSRAGDFLRRGWVRRALDVFTGAGLVALGVRLATERR